MTISIEIHKDQSQPADTAIVGVYKGNRLSASAERLNNEYSGLIQHHIDHQSLFNGKAGQTLVITLTKTSEFVRVILIGLGNVTDIDEEQAEKFGTKLYETCHSAGAEHAVLFVDNDEAREKINAAHFAAHCGFAADLKSYRFEKYKTEKKPDENAEESGDKNQKNTDPTKHHVDLEIIVDAFADARKHYEQLSAVRDGIHLARDLINEPPNTLYPESFADMVKDDLSALGVSIEIFDEKKLTKLGFEAHLAVGMGSVNKPRALIMRWNGASNKDAQPLAFVGKGVTFDTGGINIKPSAGLEAMKIDMGGGAAVAGLMKTLAMRKAKVNVIGIVGLAENMPSSNAYLPGDIIGSLSGQTIEVLNTDAEGRLVLADCMTYVQDTYDPKIMIDLATLTGAIMVALGHEYAGTFSNNDELWTQLENSSKRTGEKLWRMPLDKAYTKEVKSPIADLKNLGNSRYGGASTAAAFLEHFVKDDRPWAHIDIAGMTMNSKDKKSRVSFGVRVLDDFVSAYHEE